MSHRKKRRWYEMPDLEVVWWIDAHAQTGWDEYHRSMNRSHPMPTVGYVVKDTKRGVTLAQTYDITNGYMINVHFIPANCIVRRETLKTK